MSSSADEDTSPAFAVSIGQNVTELRMNLILNLNELSDPTQFNMISIGQYVTDLRIHLQFNGMDGHVDGYGGETMNFIIGLVEKNRRLRKLAISENRILSCHVDRLCSVVLNHDSLVELDLWQSVHDPGVGNEILRRLFTSDLKLEKLNMRDARITSEVSVLVANFIANNRRMIELDIAQNDLNVRDVELIANALRSNITLRRLYIRSCYNFRPGETYDTSYTYGLVLSRFVCDESSLNAVADSNHRCSLDCLNWDNHINNSSDVMEDNKGRKIYALLSSRHLNGAMSNVQHFRDMDVKILPDMLEAVQKYGKIKGKYGSEPKVKSVSIVFEFMRKWEKVINFYEHS